MRDRVPLAAPFYSSDQKGPALAPLHPAAPTCEGHAHDARQRARGVGHAQQHRGVARRQVGMVAVQPSQAEAGQAQGQRDQACGVVRRRGGEMGGGKSSAPEAAQPQWGESWQEWPGLQQILNSPAWLEKNASLAT